MDLKMQNTDTPIIFEGITSISALISAQRAGRSRRKIIRVYFEHSKIKKERGRFQFLRYAAQELGFDLVTDSVRLVSPTVSTTSSPALMSISCKKDPCA